MEIRGVGSIRQESSVWSGGDDVFSRSMSKADDDHEEALKWASLERLPTFTRARKGIMSIPAGKLQEVDVKKLNFEERSVLLERLLHMAEQDHERFLIKLKDRIDRVGIELPTIEVRFEHLSVEANIYVGDRGLPTILNFYVNILEGIANFFGLLSSKKQPLPILHDVSGIIRPGRLTLLLGPPGSGKTTLLLALAGKLSSDLKMTGSVSYNGHGMDEFVPQRTAAYISQHDLHMGELSVRETLAFSAKCQGVGSRYEMITELIRREKAAKIKPDPDIDVFMKAMASSGQKENIVTDYILKILGLDICADTLIGDAMRRGISGGQKKRVTAGEMLVGPARALFMDEISTGLDSSTTFQIVNTIRQTIHIHDGTAVISLLQPAPETYNLFDDVILLSDCHIVYQGRRENVLEFFETMGFKCPERKGVADFLQEVTSKKDQEQYWARSDEPYRYIPAKEFAKAFDNFHIGRSLRTELSVPYDKIKNHPAALATTRYGASNKDLLSATMTRELLLMKRNSIVYIFKLTQTMIMAVILMTVFIRTEMHHNSIDDGVIYMGALFFGIGSFMFNGFAELPMTVLKLPSFYKQRDYLFFPAWVYALPSSSIRVPLTFVDVAIWVFTTYYAIGFDPNVSRLFKQYLLFVVLNQMASALFRLLGALGREMSIATSAASAGLTVLLVLGGFVLSKDNIKKWWIWGYWISPLMYAQNALSTNEFLAHSWSKVLPGTTEKLGVAVLKSRGIFTDAKWYWIGIGAMAGYTILANVLYILALTYLNPLASSHPTISEEALKEKHMNLTGEVLEKSSTKEDSDGNKKCDDFLPSSTNQAPNQRKGMVLPFVPLSIAFENIKYFVDVPPEMRARGVKENQLELLKGISGSFRPGVLTALMGVSGAGKTTLMDVLAGRKTGGHIEGTIMVSGYPKKQETFARVSGYCEQNDIHSPHITVYESLVFSAWLRLPSEINEATRRMFVQEVMDLIELQPLKDAIVGLPGVNGLSTEQRKRLTIAVELVANPSIIFMDEPTSGLDARAAAIVMRTVRNIVDTGRTIVCTIHQPSIDIFEAFDELFLMKRGGEEIYVGPLGHHSVDLINYFEGINGVRKIENGYNPATWMLEVTTSAQEDVLGIDFSQVYKISELYQRNKELIKQLSTPPVGSSDLHFPTKYSKPFLMQCVACIWKLHLSYWRNTSYTAIRLLFTLAVAVLFGSIFWDLGTRRFQQQDLFNSMGSMYSAVMFLGSHNSSTIQPVVSVERTVLYREIAAGTYSPLSYAVAQIAIEIPYVLIQIVVYGVIVYAMIGYEWTAAKFFWYLFFMFFTLLTYTFYGMMAVALTPSFSLSSILSGAFYSLWNLFSGFLIPRTRLPIWWRWYSWLCPASWTLYGLLASQYGDIHDKLDNGVYVDDFLRSHFGFRHSFLGVVALVAVAFPLCFASVFIFSVKILNFQNR